MKLVELTDVAGRMAKDKGFDLSMHATMIAGMATEAAEVLEHITPSGNWVTDEFIAALTTSSAKFETYRKYGAVDYQDSSVLLNETAVLSELADQLLRICSYVGGNGWSDKFQDIVLETLSANHARPPRHGKFF